jgi:hypothetical protein
MDLPTRPDLAADRTLDVPDDDGPDGDESTPAELSAAVPPAARRGRARPPAVNAISLILLAVGGAMEGYAVALALSDTADRQYSLVWAFLGAALVVTAWALRGRRWWGAAAAIGVSVVGLFAGMLGVYGVLVIASAPTDDRASWVATLGLIGVGAASIAIIGLLSSAWPWLTSTGSAAARTPPRLTA